MKAFYQVATTKKTAAEVCAKVQRVSGTSWVAVVGPVMYVAWKRLNAEDLALIAQYDTEDVTDVAAFITSAQGLTRAVPAQGV